MAERAAERTMNQWLRTGILVGLVSLGLVAPFAPTARAAGAFTATAGGSIVGVAFTTVPGVGFDQLVDAGAPEAQAALDSLGDAPAWASEPYPSGSVLAAPGLVAALTEGATSPYIPPYPLVASADSVTPHDHRDAGTVALDATSAPVRSRSSATDGVNAVTATTALDPSTTDVLATATATVAALDLAPEVSISGVAASATLRRSPDGASQRTSSFTAGTLTVAGLPIPLTDAVLATIAQHRGASSFDATLAAHGVTIEYLPATTTDTDVMSAGLRITSVMQAPAAVASGLDHAVAVLTFGQAWARVTNSAFVPVPIPSLSEPAPVPETFARVPAVAPAACTAACSPAPAPPPTPAAVTRVAPRLLAGITTSVLGVYTALALAGFAAIGVVTAIRRLGHRRS